MGLEIPVHEYIHIRMCTQKQANKTCSRMRLTAAHNTHTHIHIQYTHIQYTYNTHTQHNTTHMYKYVFIQKERHGGRSLASILFPSSPLSHPHTLYRQHSHDGKERERRGEEEEEEEEAGDAVFSCNTFAIQYIHFE